MSYSVVILSANPANLVACVRSVVEHEPELPPERIIVVDDGARQEAEAQLPAVTWISGQKPFNFARNANLGIRAALAAGHDVILLNDDARLETPGGFTQLVAQAQATEEVGILSAGIRGMVGNPRQNVQLLLKSSSADSHPNCLFPVRIEPVTLAFIAVCIPRRTLEMLGELDERFSGYGFDDNDYCARALQAGLELAVWDGCVVEHGTLPPTFRSRSFWRTLARQNEEAYGQKWRALAAADLLDPARAAHRPYTLVYTARNRLELTRETFGTLWRNTNWTLVRQLVILDLGSGDGTNFWLESEAARLPVPTRFLFEPERTAEEALAGIGVATSDPGVIQLSNDTMQPPGWLRWERGHAGRYLPSPGPCVGDGPECTHPQNLKPETQHLRFDLTRLPYEPWAALADQYVAKGWQDVRPRYDPASTLWTWRWPDLSPATAATRPRFVGALRIKNEARWIGEVLERALALCSEVYVLDDHSTDETPAICQSFGERVRLIPSPFTGLDEARDKNFLLTRIMAARPDWVLWIDGDEVLEQTGPEQLRAAVEEAGSEVASFRLRIAYLWDGPRQVRTDGLWGRFMRPSLFRLQGQPLTELYFRTTSAGGNFHCGNVPAGLLGEVRPIEVRLKHYGYLEREHRQAKYVWYNQRDPGNEREDEYRHLAEIPGARHAPGPAVFTTWEE